MAFNICSTKLFFFQFKILPPTYCVLYFGFKRPRRHDLHMINTIRQGDPLMPLDQIEEIPYYFYKDPGNCLILTPSHACQHSSLRRSPGRRPGFPLVIYILFLSLQINQDGREKNDIVSASGLGIFYSYHKSPLSKQGLGSKGKVTHLC